MPFEELLDAKEIREIRKSKWLKISTTDELIGVLDMWFMKIVTNDINALCRTKKSNCEIQLHSPFKRWVKTIARKEWQCDYIENQDPTLDIIVKSLKEKWFKIIFYQKKHMTYCRIEGSYPEIGTYMSISL